MPGTLPWKMNARTVTLSTGSCSVQFRVGSKTAIVNGTSRELKSAPLLLSGKALVPLSFVAEAFGDSVHILFNKTGRVCHSGISCWTDPSLFACMRYFVTSNLVRGLMLNNGLTVWMTYNERRRLQSRASQG
ncbi:copper amine oxidase N-terminal domain-containing protein [Paenibacillus stellifer]|uniref:copper amine oxidase N-terminal domain-containing protein n=1 Tax=Paenibacillus stellifer TaxID=169760 RepID=UPI003CCBC048